MDFRAMDEQVRTAAEAVLRFRSAVRQIDSERAASEQADNERADSEQVGEQVDHEEALFMSTLVYMQRAELHTMAEQLIRRGVIGRRPRHLTVATESATNPIASGGTGHSSPRLVFSRE
jgi:hypothetical protein